jgi:hypothetical protein
MVPMAPLNFKQCKYGFGCMRCIETMSPSLVNSRFSFYLHHVSSTFALWFCTDVLSNNALQIWNTSLGLLCSTKIKQHSLTSPLTSFSVSIAYHRPSPVTLAIGPINNAQRASSIILSSALSSIAPTVLLLFILTNSNYLTAHGGACE